MTTVLSHHRSTDEASAAGVISFAQETAEFVDDGFSQFHDLFAGDNASIADARLLARTLLDQAGALGLSIGQVSGALSRQGSRPSSWASWARSS
ncbi:hypothetical protein [Enhygromyxa salina]|uniref:hypothetical protein n=1 Tax=Enhygromyxa salina TaxID=215803 RepID=UPI000D03F1CA|nr:hypothetical protein [Enhygromyxa salina]